MDAVRSLIAHVRTPGYVRLPEESPGNGHPKSQRRECAASRRTSIQVLAGIFGAFVVLLGLSHRPTPPPPRTAVDELFARQSTSLEQAAARYALRNGRPPPRNYDGWYHFAKNRGCLIDEYERIQRDFEPFYQLARDDPAFFKRMVARGTKMAVAEDMGIKTFKVEGGKVNTTDERSSNYDGGWLAMLQNASAILPDMNLVINHRDEPRVAFDVHIPHAQVGALNASDAVPFRHTPRPTSTYYTDEGHCLVSSAPTGFMAYANDASAFLLYSASADFTTDLYPVLSQSKVSPCFADILFPSEFHYARSASSAKYAFADNVPWDAKKPALYWRGQATGGWIRGSNYRKFARFRLLDIARMRPALFDVVISALYEWFCQEECDADAIKAEYNITGAATPREAGYGYKYVLDVDGNAFSGRYLGLLRSGSLVFKSTVFTEYFDDWLRPFEHYIPVRPDLSDLVERIEWAKAHDGEARRIQAAGMDVATRVLTDAQNDCYWAAVLLEWGRLQALAGVAPEQ
ncbi:glycosyl transferase family 90-domain-containing protein [Mycena belliarum]|uniref:Glycosyl transferase family 90-domain-containing protein n=1 Tax=Mycena belliarum TaxID=1033014 RepID=A0AAD6XJY3_9AGAR|nr:glycosyl transferase family 90-domain-containing protein [Mycena belliae]